MRVPMLATLAAIPLLMAGCSGEPQGADVPKTTAAGVSIQEARLVLPLVKGNPAAVYFNLLNEGDQPHTILSVDVKGAEMAMMHETIDSGGHSSMHMAQNVVLPAQGSLPFAPGARHVMVTGLGPEVRANTNTVLTINFDQGPAASVALPVIPPAAAAGK